MSLFLVGTISSVLIALSTPWQKDSGRRTPWQGDVSNAPSSTRKENRENFFRSLEDDGAQDADAGDVVEVRPPALQNPPETVRASGEFGTEDGLKHIPWAKYRKMYPTKNQKKSLKVFIWPVKGGRISSGFGIRGDQFHEGLDIAAPKGTLIRSVAAGRVVYDGYISGYGRTVVVYHGHGMATVYAHNSAHLVKEGQIVKRGDPIARVGNTGKARGHHCHFEVRQNGRPENPLRYLPTRNSLVAFN